ncbi:MAG: ArsC/Spx/MgsR family protein, partial [Staphylococcus saprophyticus]
LKDKLKDLTDDEKLDLLSANGMLVKRPLAISGDKVTVGFKEDEYKATWLS